MLAITNFALRLAEGRSVWLFLLALVGACALVVYSYWTQLRRPEQIAEPGAGKPPAARKVGLLLMLRTGVVIILVLFLFRPVVSFERRTAPRSTLAVLVDRSKSMAAFDYEGLPHRLGRAVGELTQGDDPLLALLKEDFRTQLFVFDSESRELEFEGALLDERPEGGATDILAGVRGSVARARAASEGEVAGVIVFTDGIQATAAPRGGGEVGEERMGREKAEAAEAVDPAAALASLGVPVHTVGVGARRVSEGTFLDIRLSSVKTPTSAPVGNSSRVRVRVEAHGFTGRVVTVRVQEPDDEKTGERGKEIARTELTLDDVAGDQEVGLSVTPEELGQHEYLATVSVEPAENVRWNNERSFFLNVTDPRTRVLILEGTVRAEFRFLRRLLERDPQVEVVSLVKVKRGVFRRLGTASEVDLDDFPRTREELEPFDVYVIGDLDSTHFDAGQLAEIAREVHEGGKGLLLMQGAAAFGAGGYGSTEIAPLLPVRIGGRDEPVESGEFRMRLTPKGRMHPVLEGLAPFILDGAGDAPPFEVINLVARSESPDHDVLAECVQLKSGPRRAIIVAAGRAGSGKALAITAGPTWRWAFARGRSTGGASPHARLWGQAVRWLAGVEEKERGPGVTVWLDRGEALYKPGEAVTVYARVSGPGGEALADAEVAAEVVNVASRSREAGEAGKASREPTKLARRGGLALSPSPGRLGEYEATFTPPLTGRHEIAVAAEEAGMALGEAGIKFEVETPTPETERYDIDTENLIAIAESTGGRYVPLSGARELVASLRSRQSEKRTAVVFALWNGPVFFVALVVMVGTEWFIRRRMQMA